MCWSQWLSSLRMDEKIQVETACLDYCLTLIETKYHVMSCQLMLFDVKIIPLTNRLCIRTGKKRQFFENTNDFRMFSDDGYFLGILVFVFHLWTDRDDPNWTRARYTRHHRDITQELNRDGGNDGCVLSIKTHFFFISVHTYLFDKIWPPNSISNTRMSSKLYVFCVNLYRNFLLMCQLETMEWYLNITLGK